MPIKRRVLTAAVVGLALLASACAGPSATAPEPAGEVAEAQVAAPTVEPGKPELPVTFTSDDGVEVTVTSLDRVLVLDDATIEIPHALGVGDAIAAAPDVSLVEDLARQADDRITTAGRGALTVEGVVALKPTLVIGSNMRRHEDVVTGLRDVGVPAVLIDTSQPAPDKIRKTAEVFGVAETGKKLADAVQEQIDQAETRHKDVAAADRPRVMVLSSSGAGDSGATTAAGESTPAHETIVAAGGVNTGAESGLDRYQSITAEGLIASRPEVIVVAASELDDLGGKDGIWSNVSGLSATPAAESKSLIVLDDRLIKLSGVNSGKAVVTLQGALFPAQ